MEKDRMHTLGVPMSSKEMEMVKDLAKEQGMTKSAYIRYIIKCLYFNGFAENWKGERNGNV